MARGLRFLGILALIYASLSLCIAANVRPISDAHRSAALELFASPIDGSFGSLEETYEALKTLKNLGLERPGDAKEKACPVVVEKLGSTSSSLKDLFQAVRVNSVVGCQIDAKTFADVASRIQAVIKDTSSLEDFYYSVGSLLLVKDQGSSVNLLDANDIFHSIKALSQSDGRWRYNSNSAESSTYAAGLALEALAGIVSLADSEVDQSMIETVKNDIVKLFDSIESYDDGSLFFDEKHVATSEYKGPVTTTSSVVRGVTAFAAIASGSLNIPGDKILGLAKFFLGMGVPGSSKDLFNQIDSLSLLENNRVSIPLILSLPSTVLSLSSKDQLKVEVNTVFGSAAPPLTVKLVQGFSSASKEVPALENQELKFDAENGVHYLDILPLKVDVGKYTLVFEISLHDPEHLNTYATGGQTKTLVFLTGIIKIDKAEITILNSDVGNVETSQKLDLSGDSAVALSANHLQKLRLSFQLTTPLGHAFKPHQMFLKLKHDTNVEHFFLFESSARQFKIVLDFLGLVEKFYYLSGKYDIEITVGDAAMENSFQRALGHVELDLPEPPEKAPRPPVQPADPYSRFGPQKEISHLFREPEKRPPQELSLAFLALVLLPLLVFIIGLIRLRVNLKNFPSSPVPAVFSLLFHIGIGAVLVLYVLFWLKLDLFTTLKALGLLGIFLIFVGHRTLSHHASISSKLKSS
ncbi:dolichyl-diphosphooligosaccharide--protein glycosyltransferase subunit 2 [Dioscorea cayenensis subsp. rotundata]|uniref:Dolichyl-diphosphooligosaccharide--protein glycosyltransferase subunit 2 n=1 Tax=Dioscorea cayennensis subsp. rotundata TaxID=55577 RepID=A0AB40CGS2_DIOCR|nr:dolichyl-diphosphooligosaccharide--protein glycosyltransferase subunit 2 [Dioscorea cayenensis subsp. rotundata]